MITEIIDAISTAIAQKNDSIIYLNNQPEGFERPSFFISQITYGNEIYNKSVMNNNIFIQIVYFAPYADDYNSVDVVNQYEVFDTLKDIFKSKYIKVVDRAAKITQMTGAPRDAEIYLTLNISLTESTQVVEDVPVAETINFNIKGGID
jgi:hypothetical protein